MPKKRAKSRLKQHRRKQTIKGLLKIILAIEIINCIGLWALVFDFTKIINQLKTPVATYQPPVVIEKEVVREIKTARVSAYSCGGLESNQEIMMNCPSLFSGSPKTADGSVPVPYQTMACDRANLGKSFYLNGYGIVKCTDTGRDIKGQGRFDLYVENVQAGYDFGVQYIEYYEVK